MKLDPASLLSTRLQALARQHKDAPSSTAHALQILEQDAERAGLGGAFRTRAHALFPDVFASAAAGTFAVAASAGYGVTPPQTVASDAHPLSFVPPSLEAHDRGVGRTLSLTRTPLRSVGVALFVPINEVFSLAEQGRPPPAGFVLLDVNIGDREASVDPGWRAATIDHHGPVHGRGKGRGTNSTTQLLDRFDAALEATRDAAHPPEAAFLAARSAVGNAARTHDLPASAADLDGAARALVKLELTSVCSDNVGDGLSWPVWIAQNQARVLLDPELRSTIRQATTYEDFGVFGSADLDAVKNVSALPAAVKLQSALFLAYDEALSRAGVVGTDRVPPEKAERVASEIGHAIDALLADPARVEADSARFYFQVGIALATLEEHALDPRASLRSKDGSFSLPVFDVSKLPDELGTFARWAVPPLFGPHALQLKTGPGPAPGRSMSILSVPDGRTLPASAPTDGLLALVATLNDLEAARTRPPAEPARWFGRSDVLLPSSPGTLLTAQEIVAAAAQAGLVDPESH